MTEKPVLGSDGQAQSCERRNARGDDARDDHPGVRGA